MYFRKSLTVPSLLALAALALGVWSGYSLRPTPMKPMNSKEHRSLSTRPREREKDFATERGLSGRERAVLDPPGFLIVPPESFRKIRVTLLDGTSLNHEECRMLGLSRHQIQALDDLVRVSVTRWREREKAAMKTIPTGEPGTLIHIPVAGRDEAEKEYQDLQDRILQISGDELGPLLQYRLTDGYSPSRYSNAGTGLLNVLTAGYGALDRFVRIRPLPDGSNAYEVMDFLPKHLEGIEVDEASFEKLASSGNYEGRKISNTNTEPEQISHLLQTP